MTAYTRVPVGKPRSPGWYAARDGGIGASEAAIALGWEPFGKHPLDLWHDKLHPRERDDRDTPGMRSGRYVEDAVARMWADEHEVRLVTPPALIRSKPWPWMLASLDRAVTFPPRGSRTITAPLEVKCVWHGWDDWQDAPPDHVIAQVIHQLTVLDLPRGHIAALIGGKVKSYDVEVTRAERVEWAGTIGAWWDKHIVHGERPSLDTPPADRSVIARAVPRPQWRTLDTDDPNVRHAIVSRERRRVLAKMHGDKADQISNALARMLADHERLVIDGAEVATYKPDSNGRRTLRVYANRLPQENQ